MRMGVRTMTRPPPMAADEAGPHTGRARRSRRVGELASPGGYAARPHAGYGDGAARRDEWAARDATGDARP